MTRGWPNFKPVAVEDLGAAHFHLEDREPVGEPRGVIMRGQRERELGQPPVEAGLDVGRAQAATDGQEGGGIGTAQEGVVQDDEGDPLALELPLGPLVAVEVELQGVGGVAADPEEARAPLGIQEVEVVVVHADGFPAVGEVHVPAPHLLGAGPGLGFLPRHAHTNDPLGSLAPGVVALDHVILPLPLPELKPEEALFPGPGSEPGLEHLGANRAAPASVEPVGSMAVDATATPPRPAHLR